MSSLTRTRIQVQFSTFISKRKLSQSTTPTLSWYTASVSVKLILGAMWEKTLLSWAILKIGDPDDYLCRSLLSLGRGKRLVWHPSRARVTTNRIYSSAIPCLKRYLTICALLCFQSVTELELHTLPSKIFM